MNRNVIPFRRDLAPTTVGPLTATVADRQVLDGGPDGALLEVRLVLRLADVSPLARRSLVKLLNRRDPLTLTLSDDPDFDGDVRGPDRTAG